jgi:uncharacterized protein YkwD
MLRISFRRLRKQHPAVKSQLVRLALLALVFAPVLAAPVAQAAVATKPESALVRAVNAARAERGLTPLRASPQLRADARFLARSILNQDSFAVGKLPTGVAENRFWRAGRPDAEAIVRAWLANTNSRQNLFSPEAKRIGIGILVGPFHGNDKVVVAIARFSS